MQGEGAGRPMIEIDLDEVERLASIGLNEQQVADSLGISQSTLARRKKDTEDFAEALKRGQALGIQQVANNLFEQSKEGSVPAGIFYLKNRAGWTDKQDINHSGEIDVKALTVEELTKLANGDS